ncbi:MAG: glycosyltransferase family 39 protein [Acidobacteriota bacterium]
MQTVDERGSIVLGGIAAISVAVQLFCINQYGYFRDELYYLACSEHLDWGYVDQPPLIAVVAWTARHLFGDSLLAIRILPVLAGAALIVLTGLLARRLGGSVGAQAVAAICALVAPVYLAGAHLLTMNVFEPLFWMACVYVAIGELRGSEVSGSRPGGTARPRDRETSQLRRWLLFGAIAGLSLQNKHSTLFFGLAFVVGLLLTEHRRVFLRPWIWLGGAMAFLIFLPNLIWEVRHDFATIELLRNIARSTKNAPVTLTSFLAGQITLMNPLTLPIWMAGLVWLLRNRTYRALGICYLALFAEFVILKGKIYYLAPIYPMLFAAGAVFWSAAAKPPLWVKRAYVVLIIVAGAILAPIVIPILPVQTFIKYQRALHLEPPALESHRLGPLPQLYADMFGWPEMAAEVARAYNAIPPDERSQCGIFGQNYGQAGAIDFFGHRYGLPKAISGHQNYFLWGPRGYTGDCLIVMDDDRETLEAIFEDVRQVGMVHHPLAMPYENDKPLHLCRRPKVPLAELWPKIKKWI